MSEPTVTVVKDGEGNVKYYGVGSQELKDGLEDGSLTEVGQEETDDEAKVSGDGDNQNTGDGDGGPPDGATTDDTGDSGADKGQD